MLVDCLASLNSIAHTYQLLFEICAAHTLLEQISHLVFPSVPGGLQGPGIELCGPFRAGLVWMAG